MTSTNAGQSASAHDTSDWERESVLRSADFQTALAAATAPRGDISTQTVRMVDHLHVLAVQAENYARYADSTAVSYARREVTHALAESKAAEDIRATRRNRNRFLTLALAIVLGFAITLGAQRGILPAKWMPYSFVITVSVDSLVTLYALIRHY